MSDDLIAKAAITIKAPKARVWEALVTPQAIKQYMFGTEVEADWRQGGISSGRANLKTRNMRTRV